MDGRSFTRAELMVIQLVCENMAWLSRYALIWSFISWIALGCNKRILLFMGRFMVIRLVVSPGGGSGKIWVSFVVGTADGFFPLIDPSCLTFVCDRVDAAREVMEFLTPCLPLALYIFTSPLPASEFVFPSPPSTNPHPPPLSLPNIPSIPVGERVSAVVSPIHHSGGCWRRLSYPWLRRCYGDYTNESHVDTA